jgi:pyridoxamine 5'-phosphate oxidase family protein
MLQPATSAATTTVSINGEGEEVLSMSVFTPKEIEYLRSQRLGRLATVNSEGKPQIAPVGYRYNAELDAIEIGGRAMSKSKKYRNILTNPNVAFVVDDVLPPWKPRGVEIRGRAQGLPTGGKAIFGANYAADETIIRITPSQIIGWGLEGESNPAMNRKVKQERYRTNL